MQILRAKKSDLTADNAVHMRKVVGYVHRHLAQRPASDSTDSGMALFTDELGARPR